MALAFASWAAALTLILTTTLMGATGAEQRFAVRELHQAQARTAADGGVALGFAMISRSRSVILPDKSVTMTVDGVELAIRFEDEGGKIDINQAPPALLTALFQAAGALSPERHSDAFVAQRARRPFTSITEALALIDAEPMVRRRISQSITIHTGKPSVDPASANPIVLAALFDNSPAAARRYQRDRAARGRSAPADSPYASANTGSGFTVIVVAKRPGGQARREAVFTPSRQDLSGYRLSEWR